MRAIDCLKNDSRLVSISRVCDLIKLDFTTKNGYICLHIQSALMRGLRENELLISSYDLVLPSKSYKKKLFKKFKWDIPGNSLFDDQLYDFRDGIINKKIVSIEMLTKDLILYFEGNYRIEILAWTLEPGRELFRVFKKGDLDSHFVIES